MKRELKEPDITIFSGEDMFPSEDMFSEAAMERVRKTHNLETYVASLVQDLLRSVGKEPLHAKGEPTKEYLEMLSLFAVRRATEVIKPDQASGALVKWVYDNYNPFNMSDDLAAQMKAMLEKEYLVL